MALKRVLKYGWLNVELVHSDATQYKLPENVDGILSTFALTLMPEYDQIIRNGSKALATGKRFVVADFKKPENYSSWLINLGVTISKPFGVSLDLGDRHPWESIEKYYKNFNMKEIYWGFVYIASGEAA